MASSKEWDFHLWQLQLIKFFPKALQLGAWPAATKILSRGRNKRGPRKRGCLLMWLTVSTLTMWCLVFSGLWVQIVSITWHWTGELARRTSLKCTTACGLLSPYHRLPIIPPVWWIFNQQFSYLNWGGCGRAGISHFACYKWNNTLLFRSSYKTSQNWGSKLNFLQS